MSFNKKKTNKDIISSTLGTNEVDSNSGDDLADSENSKITNSKSRMIQDESDLDDFEDDEEDDEDEKVFNILKKGESYR